MRANSRGLATVLLLIVLNCTIVSSVLSEGPHRASISSDVILDKLQKGQPVIYDHADITGDLILDSIKSKENDSAEKLVNSTIIITNSIFHGCINMDRIVLKEPVILERNVIERVVSFRNAHFRSSSSFNSTCFQELADFEQASFIDNAFFINSTFQKESNFNGSSFTKQAGFDAARFGIARFTDSRFSGNAGFGKAIFQGSTWFERSRFFEYAIFREAQFKANAYMGSAKFFGDTFFTKTSFLDSAVFSSSRFNNIVFDDANFAEDAIFENSSFNGRVSFVYTLFQKDALLYKANFSSKINLDGCKYSKLVLHWTVIKDHIIQQEEVYKDLIKNYKNLFWIKDTNECYFDLMSWKQNSKQWTDPTKFWYIIMELSWGYGTRPQNIIIWVGIFVLIFGLYYWWRGGVRQMHALDIDNISFIARRIDGDTFVLDQRPKKVIEKSSGLRSVLTSLEFSLYTLVSKNTDGFQIDDGINRAVVAIECWLGRGLIFILMYYISSFVASYFSPVT